MTTKHGTASQVTGGYVEFQAAVLRALPRDINPDVALGWTQNGESLARVLREAIEGKFVGGVTPAFVHDKTKEGWTLIENTPRRITSVRDLEIVPFLKKGESYVNGEEMVRRARVEFDANYGQEDAEYVLEHEAEIPKEFRPYYLVFPGTVWQASRGGRHVPYLDGDGSRWSLDWDWLRGAWGLSGRLVRPRK
ncbi:MAG: hypothetical protein HYT13_02415 [Candidatus Liptonbacteria bacterium]|nr:hypothetical protein [Candidatus Liptonbacteria bacterium]